jgi:hypothetical protein
MQRPSLGNPPMGEADRQEAPPQESLETRLSSQGIVISNPNDVFSYLDSHADLGNLVASVCAEVRQEFGPEAELALQVYRDPEIHDSYLSLYVRLVAYDDTIIARIDRVSEPFDEELARATGYLLVTSDFRPPRAKNGV